MKSFAMSVLLACIATARDPHTSLAQLMQLHDEMVAKLDEPNNEVNNKGGLFDRLLGEDEEKTDVPVVIEDDKKLKPRESKDDRYKGKDPARVDVPGREGKKEQEETSPGLEQRFVDTRC